MVAVPLTAMFTVDCIPPSFVSKFTDGISMHGLIAAFLTHGDPGHLKRFELWRKVWPSRREFEEGIPALWPERLRVSKSKFRGHHHPHPVVLPPSISGLWNSMRRKPVEQEYESKHQNLLAQQEKRLQDAWENVVAVFPDTDWETYSYYWLVVNTRSFFYLRPGDEPPEDRNDAVALVPFADYFNHVDGAVRSTLCFSLPYSRE
jgi:ribosomal lysine N-methyltransferase 2